MAQPCAQQWGAGVIPRECKRLAEVDFPIAVVSKHAAREKSIRHGHPSTLHLWWARRPLASSRAVLLALLLPDPCDSQCPEGFKRQAKQILGAVRQPPKSDEELRRALLWFIGAFANWNMAAHPTYLQVGRNLVKAAHDNEAPLVVDPFAGGGSIPLEALRLGCEAFASDLNPVACLILKVMLEDIPRHGPGLADELRRVGTEIKEVAEKELADLYPLDPDGATPIAYLWARTVRCEAPNCGAEIPIYRSPWLAKRGVSKARYFRETPNGSCKALLVSTNPIGGPVEFRIATGDGSENVKAGYTELVGTKAKGNTANVICPCCEAVVTGNKKNPRVQTQLAAQRGGADVLFDEEGCRSGGARLLAVVRLFPGRAGRDYRLPTKRDYEVVRKAHTRLAEILDDWEKSDKQGLCPVPDESLPPVGTLGFRVQRYGMLKWGDLFTARQKTGLVTLARLVRSESENRYREGMALVADRCANQLSHLSRWNVPGEKVEGTFSRQALPIVWDYAEVNPFGNATGSYNGALDWVTGVVETIEAWSKSVAGQVQQADATDHPIPDETTAIWFTDPPYYDAVPYADLSDFFLVWLKRTLPGHPTLQDPFDSGNLLSPKTAEAVQDETKRHEGGKKDRTWFEGTMASAFSEGRRTLREDGVGSVVFAHKTTEGWEALLSGIIRGGWTITGSWPIATEMVARLRARDSAALATSVHLVCRPRRPDAPIGDWADVLRELPKRVGDWMERLQGEGVRGADLVFACIGPALEIFSRYSRVETADGRDVDLPEYLEKVWEVVGRTALENVLGAAEAKARNGLAGALEEDARLTALFLWTLQATTSEDATDGGNDEEVPADDAGEGVEDASTGKARGFSLVFDVVRRFAQPLGIELPKWEKRTIETKKGVVRLLPVVERAKQLFGERGSQAVAAWLEKEGRAATDPLQGVLFPDRHDGGAVAVRERRPRYGDTARTSDDRSATAPATTTLDRVHTAMLLQAGGRTDALRALVQAERERGPDFLRLSNALSALYPRGSEEKRLLDAMLLAVPR